MTPKKDLFYTVAGHTFRITFHTDEQDESVIPSFKNFASLPTDEGSLVFCLDVLPKAEHHTETLKEVGQFDCGGCNHGVYLREDGGYVFLISDAAATLCCRMSANADFSVCQAEIYGHTFAQRNYGLNNAIMMAYAFSTAALGTMLVHASVIRWDGKGYMMTAPSGTGKSTHTRLWYDNIPGCDLMNDDNPVVRIIDDKAFVYGSPWSGKTPCYKNTEAPIGGIARIRQRPENSIRRLPVVEAFCDLLSAVSNMKWDSRVYTGICDSISHTIKICGMYELGCLPNAEAAILCHRTMALGK